jgi:hypothetical protein
MTFETSRKIDGAARLDMIHVAAAGGAFRMGSAGSAARKAPRISSVSMSSGLAKRR